jgi:hypothetical protein
LDEPVVSGRVEACGGERSWQEVSGRRGQRGGGGGDAIQMSDARGGGAEVRSKEQGVVCCGWLVKLSFVRHGLWSLCGTRAERVSYICI